MRGKRGCPQSLPLAGPTSPGQRTIARTPCQVLTRPKAEFSLDTLPPQVTGMILSCHAISYIGFISINPTEEAVREKFIYYEPLPSFDRSK